MVGEELEGDYFENGQQELVGGGDVDDVFYELPDVLVAFDGDFVMQPDAWLRLDEVRPSEAIREW